jgi:aspartyl-tRNA(Asn)/glutamyl-tRNA(Gln) amidotransferase subunit C
LPREACCHLKIMSISEKDVSYVADLANLELTEEERRSMVRDLNSILDYIQMLNELDTTEVEPMAQVSALAKSSDSDSGAFVPKGRDDIVEGLRKSLPQDVALANAPDTDGIFFRVPKVIER